MSRKVIVGVALAAVVFVAGMGYAQLTSLVGPEREAIIYDGDLQLDSGGIKVLPWGSGKAEPVYDETYIGPQVLKVTSQGPYQGIVLQLARPVSIADFLDSGQGYLDLRVMPAQAHLAARRVQGEAEEAQRRAGGGMRGGAGARGGGGGGGGMRGGGGGRGGGGRGGGGGGMRGGGGGGGGMRGGGGAAGGGMRGGGGGRGGGGAAGGGMRGGGGGRGGGGAAGGGMRGGGGGGMRGGGGGRGGGGRGGGGGGMRGGGGGGGGMRGGGGGTRAGATPRAEAEPYAPEPEMLDPNAKRFTVRNLRLVLFTDEGMLIADSVPIGEMAKDEKGWTPVSVPLSKLKGPHGAKQVRAVGIFANESDVFYLGRVRLLRDSKPVELTVKAEPLYARPKQVIQFEATLRGGTVDPQISWDFDKQDGVQQQALGKTVKFVYKKPGDYLVTCTVTDKAGVRTPVTKVVGIKVEE